MDSTDSSTLQFTGEPLEKTKPVYFTEGGRIVISLLNHKPFPEQEAEIKNKVENLIREAVDKIREKCNVLHKQDRAEMYNYRDPPLLENIGANDVGYYIRLRPGLDVVVHKSEVAPFALEYTIIIRAFMIKGEEEQ